MAVRFKLKVLARILKDRQTKANPIPSLVASGDEDEDHSKCCVLKPAKNSKEVVRLWSHISSSEREGHHRVVKVNALAPFLFGNHEPSIISEDWILEGYEVGLLISALVLPSQVELMRPEQLDATELVDKACDVVLKDKARVGAVLEIYEQINKERGNLKERLRLLEGNVLITRWRTCLKREAEENELKTVNDAKVLFAIAYVIQVYANHITLFTKNIRNLKEEFRDACGTDDNRQIKEEGNSYFREKQYRTAVGTYSKALSYSPYSYVLFGNRAQAYLRLGFYDQALCDSYRTIVLQPSWPKGHYRYVESLMELGRVSAAERANLVGRQKCPLDKDLSAQYEKMDMESRMEVKNSSRTHFNINVSLKNKSAVITMKTKNRGVNGNPEKTKETSQNSKPSLAAGKGQKVDAKQPDAKSTEFSFSLTSRKGKKNRGKNKESRSKSRTRTESSSGSAKLTVAKPRKKSVTIALPQPDSESDVPDLVSDDNDDLGIDSEDQDDIPCDNDTDEENKPQVDEYINSWVQQTEQKKKKETKYEKPKSTKVDEFKVALRQASEALIASQQGASQAVVAVDNYHQAVTMLENHSQKVDNVIIYCLGSAYVLKGRDSDICKGIEMFEKIMTAQFPLAYLGLGRAYLQQNRYEKAMEPAKDGLEVIKQHDAALLRYPEMEIDIPESRPGQLKVELQLLLQTAQFPPKPDAVCRYHDCSGHYKIFIYYSDPDFNGFVRVLCYTKCVIEFHLECWKKFKSSRAEKQSDKDIANGECFTPDCHSPVWKIVFINEAREVMKEILGNEPLNAVSDAPPKKVLKVPASSLCALRRKAERKTLRKQKRKEKVETQNMEENQHYTSDVMLEEAQGGSTSQADLKDGDNSSLPKMEELTMLKKDEPNPSSAYALKNKPGQKSKKGKKKEKGKVVMSLGEFTSVHGEEEEEVVTPEPVPVPPKSSMGLDDFGEIGLLDGKFNLLDPKRPFSIPSELKDEIKSFEIAYSVQPTPPVGSPGPIVTPSSVSSNSWPKTDPTPANSWKTNVNSVSNVASESHSAENAEDIKETIYCVFATLLEQTGPLHIYDKKILEELENFPRPVMDLIQKSGNIGRFLIQSLKFAMIDEFVCLMYDAVKARDLADEYKEGLKYGEAPFVAPAAVKLTEQDFPAIGGAALSAGDMFSKGAPKMPMTREETLESSKERERTGSESSLTQPVSALMAKARSIALNIASPSQPPPPLTNVSFGSSFPPSVPPGFASAASPSIPTSSPFGNPLFPSASEALSAVKWDSIQVFSANDASHPPPQPLHSNFQFPPNRSPVLDRGLSLEVGDSPSARSKSPGVIGSGTPTRNRVDLNDVSPEVGVPHVSRMFSLWQRGAGDAPSSPLPTPDASLPSSIPDKASMLDDVDDDDSPPVAPPSYNIWSQDNPGPLSRTQLPPFPVFSSWEVPKFEGAINQVTAMDNELIDDIAKSVTDELKDSPFVRYNNTDIAASIKADILSDLHKGKQLRHAANRLPGSTVSRDVGVNTGPDQFLTAYTEMHTQFEVQSKELRKYKGMLLESVRQTEIYAEEIDDLKSKNIQLEEDQVLRASEQQSIQVALEEEKRGYQSIAAATTQQLQAVYEKLNESESSNKEVQLQMEHLIEQHQKQEARIKELEEKNARLEAEMQTAKNAVHVHEERAKLSEANLLKLKSDVGAEVLDRSLKEAQTHMENLQRSKTRWTDPGESIPPALIQGIESWEKTVAAIRMKVVDSKLEFEDQMNKVKDGVPLSTMPQLPIPRPPPPPEASIMRDIMVLLHRKASPPPPSAHNMPTPDAPSSVNAKPATPVLPTLNIGIGRPPGFGMAPNRPATPPVAKPAAVPSPSNAVGNAHFFSGIVKVPLGPGAPPSDAPKPVAPASGTMWGSSGAPTIASIVASNIPVVPPSAGGVWSTVTSKKALNKSQAKGGSFSKIMMMLIQLFPNIPSERLHGYIQEVRTSRGGSLSGLSYSEVINLTSEYILNKQPTTTKNPQILGGAAAALSKFEDFSAGGASAYRSEIVEEEEDPCPICHEELSVGSVSPLECGHKFHDDCIRKWFCEQSTCPTCRVHALLPDDFPRLG